MIQTRFTLIVSWLYTKLHTIICTQ